MNSFRKFQNGCQDWDFSYPNRMLVGIWDIQAKSGGPRRDQDGWTVRSWEMCKWRIRSAGL